MAGRPSGTDVTVDLVNHDVLTPEDDRQYWVGFRFPEEIDPDQTLWTARVEKAAYDEAVADGDRRGQGARGQARRCTASRVRSAATWG